MRTQSAKRNERGMTLIELALVIGVIAIIVVGGLAIFNAVRATQDRSTALANVGVIRSAVATWAGDRPLDMALGTGLQNGAQLQPWLPGRLGTTAVPENLILEKANPWDGDYRLEASTIGGNNEPYRFVLVITEVPNAEAQALCRQLEDGAALGTTGQRLIGIGANPSGGCGTADDAAADKKEVIRVVYRV